MRRIDRYIMSEILGPLGLGFLVYTFILLLQFFFQSAEMIIRRGVSVSVVGKLLLLTLPNIIVLTVPMALLFGILIAVGRLSADSELTAMRSTGMSLVNLYRPILLISGLLTIANILLMVYALPWGNHGLQQLRLDITTQSVSKQVQPRVFYEEWDGVVIYVFENSPTDDRWRGVFLAEAGASATEVQVTVADWGRVKVDEEGEKVLLQLGNARTHTLDLNDPSDYFIYFNKVLERVIDDEFSSSQKAKVSVSKGLRQMTLAELHDRTADPYVSPEIRNLARVELHKKLSIPAACLVFGLFALPLGFNSRRGGKASGFALSIAVIMVYYLLQSNGEEAARYGKVAPWLAMWAPNILLSAIGVFILLRRNRDKSLMVSKIDRWVRRDLWSGLLRVKSWRQAKRSDRVERRRERSSRGPELPAPPQLVLRIPRFRLLFPNILDRYILKIFASIFVVVLLSGVSLYIIADLSGSLDEIIKNKIPHGVVLSYYQYMSLQIFFEIAPVIVLVTTLITFSVLARSNEITAAKALGVSLYRMSVPAVALALAIGGLSAFLEVHVLPAANQRVAQLKDEIQGRETVRTYRRADRQWLFGQGRYVYNYLHYDARRSKLQRLQVFEFDEDYHLSRRLFADSAEYVGDGWIFSKGWTRSFDGGTVSGFEKIAEPVLVDYPETPDYFASEVLPPDQMGYGELKKYIHLLKSSGQSLPELDVQLANKIAFPVVSLVMALVALPFAFRLGKQGALYGIGLSVVLGMVFMAMFALFTTLGETGALPPAIAVWSPNLIFGLFSAYLFLGVRS